MTMVFFIKLFNSHDPPSNHCLVIKPLEIEHAFNKLEHEMIKKIVACWCCTIVV